MATTLLNLTQTILSAMDSDEINAIGDTLESTQVADMISEIYADIVDQQDLPSISSLFRLNATSSATPTAMDVPDDFHSIKWIKYRVESSGSDPDQMRTIKYIAPDEFLKNSYALDSTDSNVLKFTIDNVGVLFRTNQAPSTWTTFDDNQIIFNSYDSSLETNLVNSKTSCFGQKRPTLTVADASVIDLPPELMGHLRNEARSMAFDLWKDGTTPKIEQAARRSRVRTQRTKHKLRMNQERDQVNDYGRGRRKTGVVLGEGPTGTAKALPTWM